MINVNQITSELAKMPDQALQQYAAMHKNDPYMVTLALSESNRRKQMRMGAQGAGAMPQPKVVDQDIAQMAPPPQQRALPEESGIGQLPAQNMQNMAGGGIVAFDEGGDVPGYAEGIFTGLKKKYKELKGYEFEGGPETFERALDAEGIKDPRQRAFLKSIHDKESNQAFNAPTRKDSGASGPMQVTEGAWKDVSKKGEELKNRNDPYDNMRAGIRYASTGWEKAKGDPALASTYYYGGPGGFNKAKKGQGVAALEDFGQTTLQYGNDVADKMKKFLPKNIVPGTETQAANTPSKENEGMSFWDRNKKEVIGAGTAGLAALGNAATGAYEALTPSFAPSTTPAQALGRTAATASPLGLVGLTGAGLSTGAANALSNATPEQLDQLSGDVGSDTGLAAAIMNAPNRPPEKPAMPYGEQMGNVLGQLGQTAKTVLGHPDTRSPSVPDYAENKTANAYDTGVMGGAPLPTAEEGIVAALKEKPEEAIVAAPEAKKDGTDWNDFMIKMGLNLMASKDPNAISGVGQAGLGTLAMQQAEAKAKSEAEAKMSEADYRKAMGEQARAMAGAIERGAKEKNLQLEAEKLIYETVAKDKFLGMPGNEAEKARRTQEIRETIYRQLGIQPTMAAGAPALAGGFSVVGSRPS